MLTYGLMKVAFSVLVIFVFLPAVATEHEVGIFSFLVIVTCVEGCDCGACLVVLSMVFIYLLKVRKSVTQFPALTDITLSTYSNWLTYFHFHAPLVASTLTACCLFHKHLSPIYQS